MDAHQEDNLFVSFDCRGPYPFVFVVPFSSSFNLIASAILFAFEDQPDGTCLGLRYFLKKDFTLLA